MESELKHEFQCKICYYVLETPQVHLACNNYFCSKCINSLLQVSSSCPVCRSELNKDSLSTDQNLESQISRSEYLCKCGESMLYSGYNTHQESCAYMHRTIQEAVQNTKKSNTRTVNRGTFKCPCCDLNHLDRGALIMHFGQNHQGAAAVCPICAVMPWGNPKYVSHNLFAHLSLRHKYDVDTYTDFEKNDDEILKQVLEASMQEF